MEVDQLTVPLEEVESELEHLKEAIKKGYVSKQDKLTRDLMAVYGHLQHGGKICDIHRVFAKVGLDDDLNPLIAIAQYGAKLCYLYKKNNGGAIFAKELNRAWWGGTPYTTKKGGDVALPAHTFDWEPKQIRENRTWKAIVPIVPPRIHTIASAKLTPQHYHILFEVEEWSKMTPIQRPRDPILLKRLTENIFGVIATWDLTPLEQSILAGM